MTGSGNLYPGGRSTSLISLPTFQLTLLVFVLATSDGGADLDGTPTETYVNESGSFRRGAAMAGTGPPFCAFVLAVVHLTGRQLENTHGVVVLLALKPRVISHQVISESVNQRSCASTD